MKGIKMATASDKSKSTKKVMDVAKPGKSAPSATSRPVIVGHGPMVQDPTLKTDTTSEETAEVLTDSATPPSTTLTRSKVITPPVDLKIETEESQEPTVVSTSTTDSEASSNTTEQNSDNELATTEPSTNADDQAASEEGKADEEAAVVDAVAGQVGPKKKKDELSEEEKKQQEEVQKLIDEKKYFVKIRLPRKHRKSRMALTLLFLLLLAGVGAYLAIDAGAIKVNFDLPYDFIKI